MKDPHLDPYEQFIEDNIDKMKSVPNLKREMAKHQQYAKYTSEKTRSISLRVPYKVIEHFKTVSVAEGVPYQTLINSVLHKYTTGKLKEKK